MKTPSRVKKSWLIVCLGTLLLAPVAQATDPAASSSSTVRTQQQQSARNAAAARNRARSALRRMPRAMRGRISEDLVVRQVERVQRAVGATGEFAHTTRVRGEFRVIDARRAQRLTVARAKSAFNAARARFAPARGEETPEFERAEFYFLNGRNNLESFAVQDLNEIVEGSRGDTTTVHVVQMATMKNRVARRYRIFNGVKEDLGEVPDVDFANVAHANAFFTWGITATDSSGRRLFSAHRKNWHLWDHGGAVNGDNWDDTTRGHWATSQYSQAFPEGEEAVLLVNDLCLPAGIEHAVEAAMGNASGKPVARIFQGAEETVPGEGHHYTTALQGVSAAGSKIDPVKEAQIWNATFKASYSGGAQGKSEVQNGALDLHEVADFVPRLDIFGRELMAAAEAGEGAVIKAQATATQKFFYAEQRDLVHFAQLIAAHTQRPALRTAAEEVARAASEHVIVDNVLSQPAGRYRNAHGMAVWLKLGRTADEENAATFDAIASGHPPAGYAGFRAAMPSSAMLQAVRANMANDYDNLKLVKVAPNWARFNNALAGL